MALLWFDGCGEYYATADLDRVWTSAGSGTTVGATGRRGGQAISCGQAGQQIWKGFNNGSTDRIICGMAIKFPVLPASQAIFCRVYGGGFNHIQFELKSSGAIACELVQINNQVAITSAIITADTWHYFEFDLTIGQSDGAVIMRVDGVEEDNQTGLDTRHSSTSIDSLDAIQWQGASSFTVRFDDIYICDATGTIRNTFLGDIQCDAVFPDGAGASAQFDTLTGAATHWQAVDEATPDDDTSYIETPTVNDLDLFTYGALPTIAGGSSVLGVKVPMLAKKIDSGDCNIRAVTQPVLTPRNGSSVPLQTDYDYKIHIWEQNPELTTTDWTDATINAAEFGVEKL
jgi:hypothetical protein